MVLRVARFALLEFSPIHIPNQTNAARFAATVIDPPRAMLTSIKSVNGDEPPAPMAAAAAAADVVTVTVAVVGAAVNEVEFVPATAVGGTAVAVAAKPPHAFCWLRAPTKYAAKNSAIGGPNIRKSALHCPNTMRREVKGVASNTSSNPLRLASTRNRLACEVIPKYKNSVRAPPK